MLAFVVDKHRYQLTFAEQLVTRQSSVVVFELLPLTSPFVALIVQLPFRGLLGPQKLVIVANNLSIHVQDLFDVVVALGVAVQQLHIALVQRPF